MMRILHVVSVMDVGGMESFVMNMYRIVDRTQVQFDFLVHHKRRGVFEDEIEALGGRVFHTSLMDDFNLIRYWRDLKALFSAHGDYDVVHGHLGSTAYWYLGAAKRAGIPGRILHGHIADHPDSLKGYAKHFLFQFAPANANVYLACSKEAGKYLFHEKSFEVVPNGIDVERFLFAQAQRDEIRSRLGLEDSFVVGNVGRLNVQKNHAYLLEIFRALRERVPNAKLMLLGDGELMEETRKKAQALGIADDVLFMGLIRNAAPYYSTMDAFAMPSLFEGLPLAGVEAQCSALPCVFADTISPDVRLSADVRFLPIGRDSLDAWADALAEIRGHKADRSVCDPMLKAYDVRANTEKMLKFYKTLSESNR